jgi:AcrR family transcriptional regulator
MNFCQPSFHRIPHVSRRPTASAQETRESILDVAEELFHRVGYAKTTIADIAQEMGMSSANIYRFFPSKSAINDAGCRRLMARMQAAMRATATGPGSAESRLRELVLSTHRHNRDLLTTERRVHDMVDAAMAESWDAIEEHKAACNAIFADLIADGVARGEFAAVTDIPALAETVGNACCSLFHPTLIAQCARPGGGPPDEAPALRLVWLVLEALRNKDRRPMPAGAPS